MDPAIPGSVSFIIIVALLVFCLCYRRKRDRGAVIAAPTVITAQHQVSQYPVQQAGLTAAPAVPVVQHFSTGTAVYPTHPPMGTGYQPHAVSGPVYAPYPQINPQQGPVQMPMPMPMPMPTPATAPHPQMSAMNPPSYDQIVSENYSRQAPYNPDFTGK